MNLFTPSRYDERVTALALGVEPYLAVDGARARGPLRVLVEQGPRPLETWRRWRPGETLDDVLPAFLRHRSGRYGRLYHELAELTITLRLLSGPRAPRRLSPRRLRIEVPSPTPTPLLPAARRVLVALYPGAAAELPAQATVVRGRVVRESAPDVALRWPRVVARHADREVAWAHGDDRGEFVLVIGHSDGAITMPPDPYGLALQAAAVEPPPALPPEDPALPTLDPHWDLPVDVVVPDRDPDADPRVANGRRFHPDQSVSEVFRVEVPLGRTTSVQLAV